MIFKNMGIINVQKTNTSEQLLKYSDMNIDELLKTLDTSVSGLNEDDVEVKRKIFGSNEVITGKKKLCYTNFSLLLSIHLMSC
jgi:hypothetical protein